MENGNTPKRFLKYTEMISVGKKTNARGTLI